MNRVNYEAIAKENAKSARNSVAANPEGRMAVNPVTGVLMFSQKVAAGLLDITPRAFRDLALTPDHDGGRGHGTFYDGCRIASLSSARAVKAALGSNFQGTPVQRVALGLITRDAETLAGELAPNFEGLNAYATAALAAGQIDEAGATKVRLLTSELHRVICEHDPEYGHRGPFNEVNYEPDDMPIKWALG